MGSEAVVQPHRAYETATGPAQIDACDEMIVRTAASVRQTWWWNAPLEDLGVAIDVLSLPGDRAPVGGMLVRNARLPFARLSLGSCIGGPVVEDWTSELADPTVTALEAVARARHTISLTLACPGGRHLAEDIASELQRRGHQVRRSKRPSRAVVVLAGRTEAEIVGACSRRHRYRMRKPLPEAVEIGPVVEDADLEGGYAAFVATANRKGFDDVRAWSALRPSVEAGIRLGACEMIAARLDGRVVAAILVGHTATTTEVLYAGYVDEAKPLRVNQALHLHGIRSALARGAAAYDMGHLTAPEDPTDMDLFKLRFGATVEADPDDIVWVIRPRLAAGLRQVRKAGWARGGVSWAKATIIRRRAGSNRG